MNLITTIKDAFYGGRSLSAQSYRERMNVQLLTTGLVLQVIDREIDAEDLIALSREARRDYGPRAAQPYDVVLGQFDQLVDNTSIRRYVYRKHQQAAKHIVSSVA